jgi:drug/metabolite transporter (DMT)-like permease
VIPEQALYVIGFFTGILSIIAAYRYKKSIVRPHWSVFIVRALTSFAIALFYLGAHEQQQHGPLGVDFVLVSRWIFLVILLSTAFVSIGVLLATDGKTNGER